MFSLRLRREVIALLCAKAILLFVIYQLFFAPFAKPEPNGAAMRAHFLAATVSGD